MTTNRTGIQVPAATPASLGGDLPVSRRCHSGQHDRCMGSWTQYPDLGGPCECHCHQPATDYRCQFGDYDESGEIVNRCPGQIVEDRIYCQTHADLADDILDRMRDSAEFWEAGS